METEILRGDRHVQRPDGRPTTIGRSLISWIWACGSVLDSGVWTLFDIARLFAWQTAAAAATRGWQVPKRLLPVECQNVSHRVVWHCSFRPSRDVCRVPCLLPNRNGYAGQDEPAVLFQPVDVTE